MSDANNRQVAGEHYKAGYQHWDWSRDIELNPMQYQISKYVTRSRKKNGLQDLEKALHFAEKELENVVAKMAKIATLTDEYFKSNQLTADETYILRRVSHLSMPDIESLEEVIVSLRGMIQNQKEQG